MSRPTLLQTTLALALVFLLPCYLFYRIRFQAVKDSLNYSVKKGCLSGHIRGLPPVCGNDGCLPLLPSPSTGSVVSKMPVALRKKVEATRGWLDISNADIVYYLTRAQREFGVWGSVGEIGVYYGRFTQVLGHWLDVAHGERLFVCDIFGEERYMFNTEAARRGEFEKSMNNVYMSSDHSDEALRVRVFNTSSLHLSKADLVEMGLPAFRFLSLDGNHNSPFPLIDLVTCSCLVRPGAILAMDDVLNKDWPNVGQALDQFFTHYGQNIWRPVIAQSNKIYLVTADWHKAYVSWIEKYWSGIDKAKKQSLKLGKAEYTYWRIK